MCHQNKWEDENCHCWIYRERAIKISPKSLTWHDKTFFVIRICSIIRTKHQTKHYLTYYHKKDLNQKENSFKHILKYLARSRRRIWSLSDSSKIRTHNHLVHTGTLNQLAKLAKWLSYVVSTYLYSAFDCMLLSCQVQVSEWIHTL